MKNKLTSSETNSSNNKPKYPRNQSDKKWSLPGFTVEKLVFALILGIIIIFLIWGNFSPINRALIKNEKINIVFLGCDLVENTKRADVIILLSYKPKSRFVDILTIPRDTKLTLHKYHLLRVNEYYAYGYKKGGDSEGIALTRDTLQRFLNIDLSFYVQLDFESVVKLVDALGGVKVDIKEKMDYDDKAGNLYIHFSPGKQLLKGEEAIKYLRFRNDATGDLGRRQRQQVFLKATLEKIKSPFIVFKIPQLFFWSLSNVNTNLNFYDILAFLLEAKNITQRNIRIQQLPGTPVKIRGAAVWQPNTEHLTNVLNLFNKEEVYVSKSQEFLFPPKEKIVVEVFNASPMEGAALELTGFLREKRIDVFKWGGYEFRSKRTKIIDRTGNIEVANFLGQLIGCEEIETDLNESLMVDATIIIGNDYKRHPNNEKK